MGYPMNTSYDRYHIREKPFKNDTYYGNTEQLSKYDETGSGPGRLANFLARGNTIIINSLIFDTSLCPW